MSEKNISIGALYSATHPLLIWDYPYARNRVVGEMPPEHIFLPIEKAEMFRYWFKILYNDKTGWVNVLNADYKVITDNGS
jgi:hypothetical protein